MVLLSLQATQAFENFTSFVEGQGAVMHRIPVSTTAQTGA